MNHVQQKTRMQLPLGELEAAVQQNPRRRRHVKTAGLEGVLERFLKKVCKTDSCWLWTAAQNQAGYGWFTFYGKPDRAHRISFRIFVGEIPENMCVCHTCDNRLCVNPEHLFLGDRNDNNQDMIQKGRNPFGKTHWAVRSPERIPRGENSKVARLTTADVHEIRMAFATNSETMESIAKRKGVSKRHALAVAHGRKRKHG